jgi:hypothetical protein
MSNRIAAYRFLAPAELQNSDETAQYILCRGYATVVPCHKQPELGTVLCLQTPGEEMAPMRTFTFSRRKSLHRFSLTEVRRALKQ